MAEDTGDLTTQSFHSFNFTETKLSNVIIHSYHTHEKGGRGISPFSFHLIKSLDGQFIWETTPLSSSSIFAPHSICLNNLTL